MEVDLGMALQPSIFFRLVSVQVVEHNVDFAAGMGGNDFVHKVEEFASASTLIVGRLHQSGGYFEGREKGCCAVPCVTVAEPVHSLSVGQSQITCARSRA